jgi:hypothetical protein
MEIFIYMCFYAFSAVSSQLIIRSLCFRAIVINFKMTTMFDLRFISNAKIEKVATIFNLVLSVHSGQEGLTAKYQDRNAL